MTNPPLERRCLPLPNMYRQLLSRCRSAGARLHSRLATGPRGFSTHRAFSSFQGQNMYMLFGLSGAGLALGGYSLRTVLSSQLDTRPAVCCDASAAVQKEVSLKEFEAHNSATAGMWTAYHDEKSGVTYVLDITEFVEMHPGGSIIQMAAGKLLNQFWAKFPLHNRPDVVGLLFESPIRCVGTLSDESLKALQATETQAGSSGPEVVRADSGSLKPFSSEPFNAEPTRGDLLHFEDSKELNITAEDLVTPIRFWFERNHSKIFELDREAYRVELSSTSKTANLSLSDLAALPQSEQIVTMQCAGNCRKKLPDTNGIKWQAAIANIQFRGPLLKDVLKHVGVQFGGSDDNEMVLHVESWSAPGEVAFSTCIPVSELPEGAMLALSANGESLSFEHGAPVRIILPGCPGFLHVKTVKTIRVLESNGDGTDTCLKFSPWINSYVIRNKEGEMIGFRYRMPVQSFVAGTSPAGTIVSIKGFAYSGEGAISRVEVSIDNGKSWTSVAVEQPHKTGWAMWKATVPAGVTVHCRAVDAAGNVQPEKSMWNPRGLYANGWKEEPLLL